MYPKGKLNICEDHTQDLMPPTNPNEYPVAKSVCGLCGLKSGLSPALRWSLSPPRLTDSLDGEVMPNKYGEVGLGDGAQ